MQINIYNVYRLQKQKQHFRTLQSHISESHTNGPNDDCGHYRKKDQHVTA